MMFDFYIVNLSFLYGDDPRRPSYGVYKCIYQLIHFARAFSHVNDFDNRNKFVSTKLLEYASSV